jgi:hypothetical protein
MKPQDEEGKAILERVERESAGIFDSTLARAARHFGAADAPPDDKLELWGRRIGRALSLVGFLALALLLIYQLRHP